jgi:hypothetical protein
MATGVMTTVSGVNDYRFDLARLCTCCLIEKEQDPNQ